MADFLDYFYPLPAARRSAGAVFSWWESRRGTYNLIVGAAGCFTVAATTLLTWLPSLLWGDQPPPVGLFLVGAVVYGFLANLCYFLGPLTELALYRLWGEAAPRAGPTLYRQGLIFSVGLTLFPIGLASLGLVARLLAGLFH
jgi:hypothetical protein